MYLPECQQPPVKASPRQRPIGLREEDGACGSRIFFPGAAWTHVGRRVGLVARTREYEPRALRLESRQPHLHFFHDRMRRQGRDFSSVESAAATAAVAHAAGCGTQRASHVNAHMPTCQSVGADLSPANLP